MVCSYHRRSKRSGKSPLASALFALAGLVLGTGCSTLLAEPRRPAVQEREDFLMLRDEIRRIEGRVEGLEMETQRLNVMAEEIRRRQDAAAQGHAGATRELAADFDRRMQALEAAREKDRQDIVNALSRQMADLLQQRRPAAGGRGATGTRAGGAQTGYEHEVRAGESLSTIAAAYGVRVQTIQEANQIQNPNLLRVGQVLFIPAP